MNHLVETYDNCRRDLPEQLERFAMRAETSKTYVQEFRMMRAEGVADIIYEAKFRIEELEEALRQIRDTALLSEGVEFYAMLAEKALKGEN